MKLAYIVTITTWPGMAIAIAADTAEKARHIGQTHAHDAGYDLKYVDFRAKRAPQFDDLAKEQKDENGWSMGWQDSEDSWGCLKKEEKCTK